MSCQDFNNVGGENEIDAPIPPTEFSSTGKFVIGTPPSTDHMSYDGRKIKLGLCAMAKKVNSKPMNEILTRLQYFQFLDVVMFDEPMILEEPVEYWPIVDCLICFHSAGFPLDKAVEYEALRHPFMINELQMQFTLMDRRKVHRILAEHGIPQPKYAIVERHENGEQSSVLIEHEDHIEVDGVILHKPFVEKPISAEDHNVYIYYPSSAGGGSQRLFRKIGSRSSVYSPVSRVRTQGSFIYEEFMPTDGTDVKVYTVGADYAHAEARKAPALDGKVERDKNGKEVRYPVILTAKEKMVARKVCLAFQQNVCGFDLLRTNGSSLVCDVNGFSFVKTSSKYYDDCASVLGSMILRELAPQLKLTVPPELAGPEVLPIVPTTYGTMMELRCVIAVIRHGDRTPKQKMKMEVKHERFFELFRKYGGYQTGQLKLKHPKQLQEVLDIARCLLDEIDSHIAPQDIEEKRGKVKQLKSVLEMYGYFSGINRKIQLKYQPHGFINASSADECHTDRDSSLVLILKWGGELTPAGKRQAEELGKAFRCIYPSYGETPGLGLLRLHSTYRHDLKIYASDEGRVQMTAASFAKGFLALEGELTPILVQMVKSGTHTNGLLDNADEAQALQKPAKQTLQEILNRDHVLTEEEFGLVNSINSISLEKARKIIGNPKDTLELVHKITADLLVRIDHLKSHSKHQVKSLYHSESLELMSRRYRKLDKDFKHKNGYFDVSKIPDIYDNIKYDILHNYEVLEQTDAQKLYYYCKALADVVIPQEYGLSKKEKLNVGVNIAKPLLKKIRVDLLTNAQESEDYTRLDSRFSMGVSSPDRHVRTRLYFTSESHIHSLLSLLMHGGIADETSDDQWWRAQKYLSGVSELNYLSQIVIMMYEDPSQDKLSDERFHIEVHFSPGAYGLQSSVDRKNSHAGGYRPNNGTSSHGSPVQDDDCTQCFPDTMSAEINPSVPDLIIESPTSDPDLSSHDILNDKLSPHDKDLPIQIESDRIIPESRSSTPVNESEETVAPLDCDYYPHESSAPISVQCFNSKRHHSISGGMHFSSPPGSTLISTKVISGSHSAPNLQEMSASKALEAYGLAVPEVMPMETLHNSLTLKHFDNFITKCIDGVDPTQRPYRHMSTCTAAAKHGMDSLSASCDDVVVVDESSSRPLSPSSAIDLPARHKK